ncbi:MAG TPA: Kdo hydroxylase family protein [Pyrinomonadaceae bacterium]|nr:Kdo hydroxylase family protein [Pyrinomonadaceae bacterium]
MEDPESTAMNEPSNIYFVPIASWDGNCSESLQREVAPVLEEGRVLFFPNLAFEIRPREKQFLNPAIVSGAKNVVINIATGKLGGCQRIGVEAEQLAMMLKRFAEIAGALLENVLPAYRNKLVPGRTSLRPVEIAGRVTSWRKDDTRLHVDSFPSTPVQGRRILRVFCNVNPDGRPRSWRLGEPFEDAVKHFASALRPPFPGSAAALQLLRITRGRRTAYDHYMLQLHDQMKADLDYQRSSRQSHFDFPAGTTWAVFTDQAPHAASAGQHQLEQTFYLRVEDMVDSRRSPLRMLEKLIGSKLTN